MDVVAQIYSSMRSGNIADFLSKLSGGPPVPVSGPCSRQWLDTKCKLS